MTRLLSHRRGRNLAKKKIKKKKDPTFKFIVGGLALLASIYYGNEYYMNLPRKGTMSFGICKTYIEMQLNYPDSLDLVQVFDYVTDVKMDYLYLDVYGQIRTERTHCKLKRDPTTGNVHLSQVTRKEVGRDAVEIPVEKLELFNSSIPGVVANQHLIDLTIPRPLGNDFFSYKR